MRMLANNSDHDQMGVFSMMFFLYTFHIVSNGDESVFPGLVRVGMHQLNVGSGGGSVYCHHFGGNFRFGAVAPFEIRDYSHVSGCNALSWWCRVLHQIPPVQILYGQALRDRRAPEGGLR